MTLFNTFILAVFLVGGAVFLTGCTIPIAPLMFLVDSPAEMGEATNEAGRIADTQKIGDGMKPFNIAHEKILLKTKV